MVHLISVASQFILLLQPMKSNFNEIIQCTVGSVVLPPTNYVAVHLPPASIWLLGTLYTNTWNYWRVEYLAIRSKNTVGETFTWKF